MSSPLDACERVTALRRNLRDLYRERRADHQFHRQVTSRDVDVDPDAPQHVICVVVDALRADAVTPETMPFLSGFDGGAAVSPSTWTFPAVTSLLTGQYPHTHGSMRDSDTFDVSVADMTGLPDPVDGPTLSTRLATAGYDTYGAFGFIVPFLALSGQFETNKLYDDATAERLLADHRDWFADRRGERTFSYLHLADLHEPVDPPEAYWETHDVAELDGIRGWRHEDVVEPSPTVERYRRHRRRLYRAAVEYVDNRLSMHLRRMTDLLDDVAVVVVGDHGEAFWEHAAFHADKFADPRPAYCVGHGGAPYEAMTRVPLCVEGLDATVDGRPSSLIDVAPTVASATGVDLPDCDGMSLDDRGADGDDRVLLTEGTRYGYEKKAAYGRAGGDRWKLVVSHGDDVEIGFALPEECPRELPDSVASQLRSALPSWPDDTPGEHDTSRAVERQLEQLGYQ